MESFSKKAKNQEEKFMERKTKGKEYDKIDKN